jgi:SAM-dependent methyltransferase
MADWQQEVRRAYNSVASEYAARIFDELAGKPLDRALLDRFADLTRERGLVCDLGCGPGQVAGDLHERGLEVVGVDLSPAMVDEARRLNPGLRFEVGTMLALDFPNDALAGVSAFYSIVNVPREDHPQAFSEARRVLKPGGVLLFSFHVGTEDIHLDEWWGIPVSIAFLFFTPAEVEARLLDAGFVVDEILEREPYLEVEHPSRRCYILAHKPAQA